jgi:hypothetical protein
VIRNSVSVPDPALLDTDKAPYWECGSTFGYVTGTCLAMLLAEINFYVSFSDLQLFKKGFL